MDNRQIDRRIIVGIVVVVAFVLGAIGFSGVSYNAGLTEGLMRGAQPQIIVPNANGDGARVVPAPTPSTPYYGQPYAQPYGYRSFGRGWGGWGGFGIFGFLFNVLLIIGVIWLIRRLFFRGGLGWGRWGRNWGRPGDPGWGDWNRGDANRDEQRPNESQPKRSNDDVI